MSQRLKVGEKVPKFYQAGRNLVIAPLAMGPWGGGQLLPDGSDSQNYSGFCITKGHLSVPVSSEDVAHRSSEESTLQEAQCSLKP